MSAAAWNPGLYEEWHAFVWQHGQSLVELLAPQSGECIVDLGCGTGQLTALIAETGASTVGIDSSSEMIEQARRNYPNLRFELADARDFRLAEPVDAVFSNAALHWIREPARVLASVHRALRPGGRFVAEFGGKGNVQTIVTTLATVAATFGCEARHSWYFPSVGEYASLLEAAGMEVATAFLFDRPTPLEGDDGMRNWLRMFGKGMLDAIPAEHREEFTDEVERQLRPILQREGRWIADYRRLRVVARRSDARG